MTDDDDDRGHSPWWPLFCPDCGAVQHRALILLVTSAAIVALVLMLVLG